MVTKITEKNFKEYEKMFVEIDLQAFDLLKFEFNRIVNSSEVFLENVGPSEVIKRFVLWLIKNDTIVDQDLLILYKAIWEKLEKEIVF